MSAAIQCDRCGEFIQCDVAPKHLAERSVDFREFEVGNEWVKEKDLCDTCSSHFDMFMKNADVRGNYDHAD